MTQPRIIPYDPRLKMLARHLRKNLTPSEKRLWQHLRRKQRRGYSFYRQRPIDHYIVDFYCPDLMMAIEVDGSSHDGPRYQGDVTRQQRLEELEVRVLRFSDQEVMRDLKNVLLAIDGWIEDEAMGEQPSP
jgi:very-short-patch-repair endonuclease